MDFEAVTNEALEAVKAALKNEWDSITPADKTLIQRVAKRYAELLVAKAKGQDVAADMATVALSINNIQAAAALKAATFARVALDAAIGVAVKVLKIAL